MVCQIWAAARRVTHSGIIENGALRDCARQGRRQVVTWRRLGFVHAHEDRVYDHGFAGRAGRAREADGAELRKRLRSSKERA